MDSGLAGVVLAAGEGRRLRPLTLARPKALCTVGAVPLVDLALERIRPYAGAAAVNVHHHRDQLLGHLSGRPVHISVEEDRALGTAGGLAHLRPWLDGRAVLLTNADAWSGPDLDGELKRFVTGWDGERPRLLTTADPASPVLDGRRYVGTALLPWWSVRDLPTGPSGLWEVSWRGLYGAGRVEVVDTDGDVVDCGTPADYLRANLLASGGAAVVEPGGVVEGRLVRSVLWAGERVAPDEVLVEAVRGAGVTLYPWRATREAG